MTMARWYGGQAEVPSVAIFSSMNSINCSEREREHTHTRV